MTEERRPKGISRRTIVKGAAWAVPTIPLVAAAPAYAVSGTVTGQFLSACKSPGNSCAAYPKGYILSIEICNQTNYDIMIAPVSVDDGLLNGAPTDFLAYGGEQEVLQGQCTTVYIGIDDQGASPQASISGTLNYVYWAPDLGETKEADGLPGDVDFAAPETPPCAYPNPTPPPPTTSCPPGFS